MVTNREIASLILLGVFIVAILFIPGVRKSLGDIAKLIFGKHILPILLLYLAYAAGVIVLAAWLKVWDHDLLKDTILVVLLVGLPLIFNAGSAKSGVSLVRKTFAETVGVSVLLLFYINLVSLPIVAEIVLQLFVIVISTLAAFAGTDSKYRVVAKLMNGLLGLIGLGLLGFTTVNLVMTWYEQDPGLILRTLLLSIWFPLALLPLIYLVSFYAQAQLVFVMLPFFNDRKPLPTRVRLAIVLGFHGSTRYAASFIGEWRGRAGKLRRFKETQRLMKEYRKSLKENVL